jgi:hypothetical protein
MKVPFVPSMFLNQTPRANPFAGGPRARKISRAAKELYPKIGNDVSVVRHVSVKVLSRRKWLFGKGLRRFVIVRADARRLLRTWRHRSNLDSLKVANFDRE